MTIVYSFPNPDNVYRCQSRKLFTVCPLPTVNPVQNRFSAACPDATTGRFPSLAELLIGTKVVHFSAIIGLILQTASILLGFVLCMMLILSKAFQSNYVYMSATALTVYNLAWTALTYLAVSMKKT